MIAADGPMSGPVPLGRIGVVIEVNALTKRYGGTTAVDNLSFTVRPGQVTGFLGPNGAGKSTTLRMILGLDTPSGGTATVCGVPFRSHPRGLRHVGALLDAHQVHGGRSAVTHLSALARSNGIARRRVDEVLREVGLSEVARRRIGGFSLGMKQRLGIATALLGDPPVLMFDEPINGMDPEGVLWVRNLFRRLAAEGRTVFLSSHLMTEMENTADQLRCHRAGAADRRRVAGILCRPEHPAQRGGPYPAARRTHGGADGGRCDGRAGGFGRERKTHRDRAACGANRRARPGQPDPAARTDHPYRLAGGSIHGTHRRKRRVPGRADPMSAYAVTPPAPVVEPPARFRDLLGAEWIKMWSLRSTGWMLALATLFTLGSAALAALGDYHNFPRYPPEVQREHMFSLGDAYPLDGYLTLMLVAASVGAITMVSEYGSGLIRTTTVAVPARGSVVLAKAVVLTAVWTVAGAFIATGTFVVSQSILDLRGAAISVTDPSVFRAMVVSALLAPVCALIGLGFGVLIRHGAATMITSIFVLLMLPLFFASTSRWSATLDQAMLLTAWQRLTVAWVPTGPDVRIATITESWIVYAVWPLVAIVLALVVVRRRDV